MFFCANCFTNWVGSKASMGIASYRGRGGSLRLASNYNDLDVDQSE